MRKLLYISLLSSIILCLHGCGGNSSTVSTKEQQDSIVTAKADSIRMADSIAAIKKAKADSIARINAKEKEERIAKISKNFREKKDEFSDFAWVEHKTTTPYRNRNSIHLSFQKAFHKPFLSPRLILSQSQKFVNKKVKKVLFKLHKKCNRLQSFFSKNNADFCKRLLVLNAQRGEKKAI